MKLALRSQALSIGFVALLAASSAACAKNKLGRPPVATVTTTSAPAPSTQPAPPPEPPKWQLLESREGAFSVEMPKAEKKTAKDAVGDIHFWQAKQNGLVYTVAYHDVPAPKAKTKPKPQETLHDLGNAFFTGCKGSVMEDKGLVVEGHAARRFLGECAGGLVALGEVHVVGARAYELFVIMSDTSKDKEADRFLKSFHVVREEN